MEDQENQRQRILVLMGAIEEGEKEWIVAREGYSESEASLKEFFKDIKNCGLSDEPEFAAAIGLLKLAQLRGLDCSLPDGIDNPSILLLT